MSCMYEIAKGFEIEKWRQILMVRLSSMFSTKESCVQKKLNKHLGKAELLQGVLLADYLGKNIIPRLKITQW